MLSGLANDGDQMSKRSVSGQGELLEAGRPGLMSAGGGGRTCGTFLEHSWMV